MRKLCVFICYLISSEIMDKTTCPLNNVKKKKHKFYDMTNFFFC